ncbi:MAG: histidine--tRNA ligase [Coriobacteriia bacterium]|nr:histidine--tRNA ligase [Coriobacteriia bacterium]
MANTYTAPKGTTDLIGVTARAWEFCTNVAREVFGRYGYEPIYTPIFEATEVFTRGLGEATDVVGKEMYTFEDRGEREITLRPENTAGVVRAAINAGVAGSIAQGGGVKLYYAGPQFRYERPQKGRQRQFYQIGAEALGFDTPEADAEIIAMLMAYFPEIGITRESMRLLINSMGCAACRPAYRDAVEAFIRAHAGELCERCVERADTNPLRALDCKNPACRTVFAAAGAPRLSESLCEACAVHDAQVKELLDLVQITWEQDDTLVRGLDYYTRTVFEVVADTGLGASQNALGGGGRYDGLAEALGGKSTPGIGFAIGFERVLLVLEAQGAELAAAGECDLYVACASTDAGDGLRARAFDFATQVRDEGWYVQIDLAGRSLKSQMKAADKAGAYFVAILAPDEDERGGVTLRDMQSKEERFVAYEEFLSVLEAS